jgi:hypothetical protein
LFCGEGNYGFINARKGQALRVLQKIFRHPADVAYFIAKTLTG